MSEQLPNQAQFEFDGDKNRGERQIMVNANEIGMLHAQMDNHGGKFDIFIEDQAGNIQYSEANCQNPTGRWGKRIDLPVVDSTYKVRLENVSGCKSINVFAD